MQRWTCHAILACLLAGGCAARIAEVESELAVRTRLQAAHDATLRLELHGRLDAATLARGVREVRTWCDESDFDVTGSVDASGMLSIVVPTIEAHNRCLTIVHVVDLVGAHWYCWFDLTKAPVDGRHDLGDLQLQREPEGLLVVDDQGLPLTGARVLLHQQYLDAHPGLAGPRSFETITDERGCASLCRAAPFEADARLVVRHDAFAPWSGPLSPRAQLDHGGEIRGRVAVPAGADPADFVVGVWVDEASPQSREGERVYASVTAPLLPDGSYRLRNVPAGRRTVRVLDRNSWEACDGLVRVEVGLAPAAAPELSIEPSRQPSAAMRIRLLGHDGRAAVGTYATIHISDVGVRVPMHDGYVDWFGDPRDVFAIAVPGHGVTDWNTHRSGELCRLQGGYRVGLRLDLDAARRLPPTCALRATVAPLTDDATRGREPALYLDRKWYEDNATPLDIARDAPIVVDSPGRYRLDLALLRWDATGGVFVHAPIDVEPREFEVRADTECTLVPVSSGFAVTPP